MTPRSATRWTWEKTDPDRSGSSGDLAKLFKNEAVKNPGVFAVGAPSEPATLMAREVIQNAADAAAELVEELGDDAPELEISFEFESLTGDAKASFVEALDLGSIAARSIHPADPGWRACLGLDRDDALDHLDDEAPMRLLKVIERGTTGMYGPFSGAQSKMYLALISLGYTAKSEGAGGSYGYGKAGLIRGSAIRTVVAYSAFQKRKDDPGVTRRLLGMTYWGQHDLDGVSYTGFARFGSARRGGAVRPFENEAADAIASSLGLDARSPDDLDDLGTTFLLIEPTVTPDDLNAAVARNWWPALEDRRMSVMVSADGTNLVPRPMKDPLLRTFVDAYHLAATEQDNPKPNQYRQSFRRVRLGDRLTRLGSLGLMAEPGGWSYESESESVDPDEGVQHRSLVALVRGPRMVVEYLDAGRSRPFVRGVFLADDEVDELLRQTEPKAHDSWQTRLEPGSDPDAPRAADAVITRIRDHVRKFREQLRPASRPAEDVRLPELERLFGRIFSSTGTITGPPSGERPFSISVDERVAPAGESLIRLEGRMRFALAPHHTAEHEAVEVLVSYRFVEEGGNGEEAELAVTPPAGFEPVSELPYLFRGTLTHDRVTFLFESAPYPADWTGRLKGDVELLMEREAAS